MLLMSLYKFDDRIVLDITESESKNAQAVCAMLAVYKGTSEGEPAPLHPKITLSRSSVLKLWIDCKSSLGYFHPFRGKIDALL